MRAMEQPGVDELVIEALGVPLRLRVPYGGPLREIRAAWSDAIIAAAPPPAAIVEVPWPDLVWGGGDTRELLHHLSPAVTQRAIAARRGELVMLHAAALADPVTGATAVLVAPSGTGKTTASRALGTRFAYLSDETAAITRKGVVLPYRKPLSIIEDGPIKAQRSPGELGLITIERECRLAALLVIQRDPHHQGAPRVVRLQTVDAIAAVAPESSYLPSLDQPLHRLAELIGLAGGAHRVTYCEAESLTDIVDELLAARR